MLTINHMNKNWASVRQDDCMTSFEFAVYTMGLEKPNYPVPALIYEACQCGDHVAVLERGPNSERGYFVYVHCYPEDVDWNDFDFYHNLSTGKWEMDYD